MRQPWDFTNEDPGLAAARAVAGKGKVRMLRDPGDPETSTLAALHYQPPVWTGQPHDPDSWCPSFPQQNTSILSPTAFPMRFPPSTEPFFFLALLPLPDVLSPSARFHKGGTTHWIGLISHNMHRAVGSVTSVA